RGEGTLSQRSGQCPQYPPPLRARPGTPLCGAPRKGSTAERSNGSRVAEAVGLGRERGVAGLSCRKCNAGSPEWWRVDEAAIAPGGIGTALELQGRFGADIAVEDLAVIAHLLDDVEGPVLAQPELLAEIIAGAEQPLHLRVGRTLP